MKGVNSGKREKTARRRAPAVLNAHPDANSPSPQGLTLQRFNASTHPPLSPSRRLLVSLFLPATATFFALFFLYVCLRIEPVVQFNASGPVFYLSRSFLNRFVMRPGGCLEYAAAFLAQLDYYNWLGALVFTVLAGLLFLGTRRWLRRFSGGTPVLAPFVPPFLLLLLREQADASFLASGLGVCGALGAALGYALLPRPIRWGEGRGEGAPLPAPSKEERGAENPKSEIRNPKQDLESLKAAATGLRLALCSLLSVLLFYLAGLWPCLLWAMLAGAFELRQRRHWLLAVGCVLSGWIGPLWLMCCRDTNLAKLLLPWKPGMPTALAAALFLFLPLASLALWIFCRPTPSPARRATSPQARWSQAFESIRVYSWFGFFLLGWAAVWQGLDAQRKALAQIDYYASQKDYEKVLTAAGSVKGMTPSAEIRLHLALHHTGRLCQDLFTFTNQTTWRLLPSLGAGLETCRAQSQTLLELGQVSEAEHLAHEALEWEGERPETLRLLAQINILKERPQAARVFLNALRQVPTQRGWAEDYLRQLAANPSLPEARDLAQIRARMVKTDLPHVTIPMETFMRQLLHSNPRNQMAFDYLMAYYLLALKLDKVVDQIKDLDGFGYQSIPRHIEEAILLHQQLKGAPADLCSRTIRPETLQRFDRWREVLRQADSANPERRAELARDFGDTYWYYFLTRQGAQTDSKS